MFLGSSTRVRWVEGGEGEWIGLSVSDCVVTAQVGGQCCALRGNREVEESFNEEQAKRASKRKVEMEYEKDVMV